jgi:hypothetical protein
MAEDSLMTALAHWRWLAALPLFVATCGDAPVPGATSADPALQHDVTNLLTMMDSGRAKGCSQRKVVDTQSIETAPDHETERWVIDRCGERVGYSVTFKPNSHGGTDFNIQPEK